MKNDKYFMSFDKAMIKLTWWERVRLFFTRNKHHYTEDGFVMVWKKLDGKLYLVEYKKD